MAVIEHRKLSCAERSLLMICGFEWSDDHGFWIDADGHRWDNERDAVEECHALADSGWQATPPEGWPEA